MIYRMTCDQCLPEEKTQTLFKCFTSAVEFTGSKDMSEASLQQSVAEHADNGTSIQECQKNVPYSIRKNTFFKKPIKKISRSPSRYTEWLLRVLVLKVPNYNDIGNSLRVAITSYLL